MLYRLLASLQASSIKIPLTLLSLINRFLRVLPEIKGHFFVLWWYVIYPLLHNAFSINCALMEKRHSFYFCIFFVPYWAFYKEKNLWAAFLRMSFFKERTLRARRRWYLEGEHIGALLLTHKKITFAAATIQLVAGSWLGYCVILSQMWGKNPEQIALWFYLNRLDISASSKSVRRR